ncbi:MAG: UDP-N-acetylmuramoyl-L-alanyl-D-glutamate--2,6-diaminopimelate ligase [Candidatus Bipolaricaulota bacterium]|nr:UDP-N-acetylmuramoyl-L-alanyl-D-glutamate--2,6-diaminopimelate ligase [Candidatus Bipolaricaulota bacterium]
MHRLAELAAVLGKNAAPGWENIILTGISEDSRQVRPGYLFVAIGGYKDDGHRYIGDAIANGAVAIVGEQELVPNCPYIRVENTRLALAELSSAFFDHPTRRLFTVGVTGTNGKTTVCHLIAQLLGVRSRALVSTVENERRGLHAVTTPASPLIQRIAASAVAEGDKSMVIEVSSIALSLHRTCGVDFDAAVFTNFTHDHLDLHGKKEDYLQAKLLLFRRLKSTALAVVNLDDPVAESVIRVTPATVMTYGINQPARLRAASVRYRRWGSEFTLAHGGERVLAKLPLPGGHNVYNALAATALALNHGLTLSQIAERLAVATAVAGRYQSYRMKNGATVIVDFAHSPDALKNMLDSLRPFYRRVICVFGCGGESDTEKRPLMGEISGMLADFTIITTDNPKSEPVEGTIAEIEAGIRETGARYIRIVDREEAIHYAIDSARSGDVVLIAGKGHETYQIIGDEFVPYSDTAVLNTLLNGLDGG